MCAHHVEIANENLTFRLISIIDPTPTGAQIAEAAGFNPSQNATVLQVLSNHELEDIRPLETIRADQGTLKFIVTLTDRLFLFTIDGQRVQWPSPIISGATLRKLGNIPDNKEIYQDNRGETDTLINETDLISLDLPQIEEFRSRERAWKINVQGIIISSPTPTITVKAALIQAGFDPNKKWHIFLKIAGQPKKALTISDVVDLSEPGIEKIRLTPHEINNGESTNPSRRDFTLLPADEAHLNTLNRPWETINSAGRRWLLIHDYPTPRGYTRRAFILAIDIPNTYPGSQLDMFYAHPQLHLESGRIIPCTETIEQINDAAYQRWSRHRGPTEPWDPNTDNIQTHLALVDSSLEKETEA